MDRRTMLGLLGSGLPRTSENDEVKSLRGKFMRITNQIDNERI